MHCSTIIETEMRKHLSDIYHKHIYKNEAYKSKISGKNQPPRLNIFFFEEEEHEKLDEPQIYYKIIINDDTQLSSNQRPIIELSEKAKGNYRNLYSFLKTLRRDGVMLSMHGRIRRKNINYFKVYDQTDLLLVTIKLLKNLSIFGRKNSDVMLCIGGREFHRLKEQVEYLESYPQYRQDEFNDIKKSENVYGNRNEELLLMLLQSKECAIWGRDYRTNKPQYDSIWHYQAKVYDDDKFECSLYAYEIIFLAGANMAGTERHTAKSVMERVKYRQNVRAGIYCKILLRDIICYLIEERQIVIPDVIVITRDPITMTIISCVRRNEDLDSIIRQAIQVARFYKIRGDVESVCKELNNILGMEQMKQIDVEMTRTEIIISFGRLDKSSKESLIRRVVDKYTIEVALFCGLTNSEVIYKKLQEIDITFRSWEFKQMMEYLSKLPKVTWTSCFMSQDVHIGSLGLNEETVQVETSLFRLIMVYNMFKQNYKESENQVLRITQLFDKLTLNNNNKNEHNLYIKLADEGHDSALMMTGFKKII